MALSFSCRGMCVCLGAGFAAFAACTSTTNSAVVDVRASLVVWMLLHMHVKRQQQRHGTMGGCGMEGTALAVAHALAYVVWQWCRSRTRSASTDCVA